MNSKKLFITATNTDAGKTFISTHLLQAFAQEKLKTLALKPIASGAELKNGKWINDDAIRLQAAATIFLPIENVNPFVFELPIAPHIAAYQQKVELSVNNLNKTLDASLKIPADICLIEGAGGWLTPLNNKETLADFVLYQRFHIILIVNIQLGCINHALLTTRALQQSRAQVLGWIANCTPPTALCFQEQIQTLRHWLPYSYLGLVSSNPNKHSKEIKEIGNKILCAI